MLHPPPSPGAVALAAALLLSGCHGLVPSRPAISTPGAGLAPAEPATTTATTGVTATKPTTPPAPPPPPGDLWERLRRGFALAADHPRVSATLERYWGGQRSVDHWARQAAPFLHLVVEEVASRGLPMELALLPVVESHYDPEAYSRSHAAGLWQIIPATGRRFGLRQDSWFDGRRDPLEATRAALDYLEYLHGIFAGDWPLALAAYNAGEGTVLRAMARNRGAGRATDYWSLDLPPQTRAYIPKLLAVATLVRAPESHGIRLPPLPDRPALARVELPAPVDLELAAQLAGMDPARLRRLNPGYRRWSTPVEGPYRLLLPEPAGKRLQAALVERPRERWVRWHRHQVRPGDSLWSIARANATTVAQLRSLNGLGHGAVLHPGQTLKVAAADPTHNRRDAARAGIRHRVQPGESLWAIARRFGVTAEALRHGNGLSPDAVLQPGQELLIPAPPAAT